MVCMLFVGFFGGMKLWEMRREWRAKHFSEAMAPFSGGTGINNGPPVFVNTMPSNPAMQGMEQSRRQTQDTMAQMQEMNRQNFDRMQAIHRQNMDRVQSMGAGRPGMMGTGPMPHGPMGPGMMSPGGFGPRPGFMGR